ncbi:unnamed protein product [Tuber melanosporum]|uniref:(Perigord truffle) hypothetical protein n=1 Tax=Tuber melanosporum (strain Mel28) TaxID=656061 RepID=D5G4L0_TUBMM|nr:uncharacterized protein GSTUM_00004204001 [Tuber melanosporum]CAZ79453.1 unnamed protein product [Tuber melanosporum]
MVRANHGDLWYVFGRAGIARVKHWQRPGAGDTCASTGAECLAAYSAYIWQRLENGCCGHRLFLSRPFGPNR